MGRRNEANASRSHAKALAALKKDAQNEVDFCSAAYLIDTIDTNKVPL
jgi:hypothetical protein